MTIEVDTEWDVFVSHASEDKVGLVNPLSTALDAFGVQVWYDEFNIRPGASLKTSIDEGLQRSQYGLVVLSPAFFARQWTQYELDALAAREARSDGTLLALWHDMGEQDLERLDPALAALPRISTGGLSHVQLAALVIKRIRPDIHDQILTRMRMLLSSARAETREVPGDELHRSPRRHEELPSPLVSQIRLVRAVLLGMYSHSMAYWLGGFQRDSNPSKNVREWLRYASVVREAFSALGFLTPEQIEALWRLISGMSFLDEEQMTSLSAVLPEGALNLVAASLSEEDPVVDYDEAFPVAHAPSGATHPSGFGDLAPDDELTVFFHGTRSHPLCAEIRRAFEASGIRVREHDLVDSPDDVRKSDGDGTAVLVLSPEVFAQESICAAIPSLLDLRTVVPIRVRVTPEEVASFHAQLADRVSLDATEVSAAEAAVDLVRMTHRHVFQGAHRVLAERFRRADGASAEERRYFLPVFHETISEQDRARIRCIRAALLMIYPCSMSFWVEGFRREPALEEELARWERLAAVFHEVLSLGRLRGDDAIVFLFLRLLELVSGGPRPETELGECPLTEEQLEWIRVSVDRERPYFEIEDEGELRLPADSVEERSPDVLQFFENLDKERFPTDLPVDLVRALMRVSDGAPSASEGSRD